MNSTKNPFLKGFDKTAGLPKWLHEAESKAQITGQSKKGVTGLMKRRGVMVGSLFG